MSKITGLRVQLEIEYPSMEDVGDEFLTLRKLLEREDVAIKAKWEAIIALADNLGAEALSFRCATSTPKTDEEWDERVRENSDDEDLDETGRG